MPYKELLYIFNQKITITVVLYGTPSVRNRLWVMLVFGILCLFVAMAMLGNLSLEGFILFAAIIVLGVILESLYFYYYADKRNRLAVIKRYPYNFSEVQKKDTGLILNRIQLELLKKELGVKAQDLAYLKSMIKISEEYSSETKTGSGRNNVGITVTIILLILSNSIGFFYDYLKREKIDLFEVFENTIRVICYLSFLALLIYLIKEMIISQLNTNHYRNEHLRLLLKDLEVEVQHGLNKEV